MGTHEENKARRRKEILAAARHLIRERPNGEFSMPELAKQAGTSLATPYNLIGTKDQIFLSLYDEDNERFRQRLSEKVIEDPIERLRLSSKESVSFWLEDELYYQHLHSRIHNAPKPVQKHISLVRFNFWLEQSTAARNVLRQEFEIEYLAFLFSKIHASSLREWVIGTVPSDCISAELNFSLAIALMQVVIPSRKKQVQIAVAECQRELSERGWHPLSSDEFSKSAEPILN